MTPGQVDLYAYRWQQFAYAIAFPNLDLSGAAFAAMVRAYPDAPGAALVTLGNAAAGAEGLYPSLTTTAGVPTTTLAMTIAEATLTALMPYPSGGAPGANVALAWDLKITPVGGVKARWLQGQFIIVPGVTH